MKRALLFMPAGDERKLRKLGELPPCDIVFDCEDAVPLTHKAAARAALGTCVATARDAGRTPIARVNGLVTPWWEADARAAVAAGARVLLLPKAEDARAIARLGDVLASAERRAGLPAGTTRLIVLIETALGVLRMREVLDAPRVDAATIGIADLAADLGTAWHTAMQESPQLFLAERTQLALVSRALRREAPWDPVYLAVDDEAGFLADVALGRRIGAQGKFVIHPRHVAAVQAAYAVAPAERERAQRIVAAYDAAAADGRGAVAVDGVLVDEPVVALARTVLERSARE